MDFVYISRTGIRASRIALGTWAIGGWMWGGTEEHQAVNTIRAALDLGINLIDTAPVYGFGRSEELVGRALAEYGNRDQVIIATKAGLEWDDKGRVFRNSSKQRILREIDDSLYRLRTDYIDIYQIHWPDPTTPFEETAETMNGLYRKGKIKAVGVSNYNPQQMDEFKKYSELHASQPPYNLFERKIQDDILPYCIDNNITTLVYGSLCRGLLTGRMQKDTKFKGDDLRKIDPKFRQPRYNQYLKAVTRLDEYAREKFGKGVIHLAIRWLLDRHGVNIALWGARRPDQLDPVSDILGWKLDESSMESIDTILKETVIDPVGPEFMAPPASLP
ncbi:MAG: general stress protein [delta proteobacterium ML8_D]|jgi:aryl-alcohol dehydrogenase-like predicted oxidoreductase|nr:MAG: general stress protein [delta proteobacterium ML8_D]